MSEINDNEFSSGSDSDSDQATTSPISVSDVLSHLDESVDPIVPTAETPPITKTVGIASKPISTTPLIVNTRQVLQDPKLVSVSLDNMNLSPKIVENNDNVSTPASSNTPKASPSQNTTHKPVTVVTPQFETSTPPSISKISLNANGSSFNEPSTGASTSTTQESSPVHQKSGFTKPQMPSQKQLEEAILENDMDVLAAYLESVSPNTKIKGDPLVFFAILMGSPEFLRLLLSKKVNLNIKDKRGNPPLFVAHFSERFDLFEILLPLFPDINMKNDDGNTILHLAIEPETRAPAHIIRAIIAREPDLDVPNSENKQPFIRSIAIKDITSAKLMLPLAPLSTKFVNYCRKKGQSVPILDEIIAEAKRRGIDTSVPPPPPDLQGLYDIHKACENNNIAAINTWHSNHHSLNLPTKIEEDTPAHICARLNKPQALLHLIALGANINLPNRKNYAPIHIASMFGRIKILEILLKHKVPIDSDFKEGSPLLVSIHASSSAEGRTQNMNPGPSIGWLLQHGANIDYQRKRDLTPPLYVAIIADHFKLFMDLLKHGANPLLVDSEGKAAKDIADLARGQRYSKALKPFVRDWERREASRKAQESRNQNREVYQKILKYSPGVTSRSIHSLIVSTMTDDFAGLRKNLRSVGISKADSNGWTCLHHACHNNNQKMVKSLISFRCDIHALNKAGQTCLHTAVLNDSTEAVRELFQSTVKPNVQQKDKSGKTVFEYVDAHPGPREVFDEIYRKKPSATPSSTSTSKPASPARNTRTPPSRSPVRQPTRSPVRPGLRRPISKSPVRRPASRRPASRRPVARRPVTRRPISKTPVRRPVAAARRPTKAVYKPPTKAVYKPPTKAKSTVYKPPTKAKSTVYKPPTKAKSTVYIAPKKVKGQNATSSRKNSKPIASSSKAPKLTKAQKKAKKALSAVETNLVPGKKRKTKLKFSYKQDTTTSSAHGLPIPCTEFFRANMPCLSSEWREQLMSHAKAFVADEETEFEGFLPDLPHLREPILAILASQKAPMNADFARHIGTMISDRKQPKFSALSVAYLNLVFKIDKKHHNNTQKMADVIKKVKQTFQSGLSALSFDEDQTILQKYSSHPLFDSLLNTFLSSSLGLEALSLDSEKNSLPHLLTFKYLEDSTTHENIQLSNAIQNLARKGQYLLINQANVAGITPLHILASERNTSVLSEQLFNCILEFSKPTRKTSHGIDAFYCASNSNNITYLRSLFQKEGKPSFKVLYHQHGMITPLHGAVLKDSNIACAKHLLNHGHPVDISDPNGNTPLHIALKAKCYHIALLLIQWGAHTNCQNNLYETPLKLSNTLEPKFKTLFSSIEGPTLPLCKSSTISIEHQPKVRWVPINNEHRPNTDGPGGIPFIQTAVLNNIIEPVRNLLIQGHPVNTIEGQGHVALHWAANKNFHKMSDFLLINGADPLIKAPANALTPVHFAVYSKPTNIHFLKTVQPYLGNRLVGTFGASRSNLLQLLCKKELDTISGQSPYIFDTVTFTDACVILINDFNESLDYIDASGSSARKTLSQYPFNQLSNVQKSRIFGNK